MIVLVKASSNLTDQLIEEQSGNHWGSFVVS
jgi:hypothetical protein